MVNNSHLLSHSLCCPSQFWQTWIKAETWKATSASPFLGAGKASLPIVHQPKPQLPALQHTEGRPLQQLEQPGPKNTRTVSSVGPCVVSCVCILGCKGIVMGACSQGCGLDCVGWGREEEERGCGFEWWSLLWFLLCLSPVVFLNTDLNIPHPCLKTLHLLSSSVASLGFQFSSNALLTLHLSRSHWSCRAVQAAASPSPFSPRLV